MKKFDIRQKDCKDKGDNPNNVPKNCIFNKKISAKICSDCNTMHAEKYTHQ